MQNVPEIIGCDQHSITFFYCYCYGEAHQQHLTSLGEIRDTSIISVFVHLVANNGCCVNTCISTKDFVKICRYVYQDGLATKMGGADTGCMPDIYQYQLNRIIAEKSTNVCINQCLRPPWLREIPACRVNGLMYRNTVTVTRPSPPGFFDAPRKTCPPNLGGRDGGGAPTDDDLDIEKLVGEFRTKTRIHVDYEKRFVITRFFVMNLNVKILKFVKDNQRISEYDEALNCVKLEKLFVMPVHVLKRLGFDVLFVEDEDTTFVSTRRGQTRTVLNAKIVNKLAMEVVDNDAFVDEVVGACNSCADMKGRMPYAKTFGTTD